MAIFKPLAVAFSLYSRIPMPRFQWREEDMKHNLVFFPLVGLVVGALAFTVAWIADLAQLNVLTRVAIVSAVPLIVTGGFHVDGFMDVEDALRSYKSREEKLAILKDPHIGAFAVICLASFGLLWCASLSVIVENLRAMAAFALFFYVVRALSGALALRLRPARKDGMLRAETAKAGAVDFWLLTSQALLGTVAAIAVDWRVGLAAALGVLVFTGRYKRLCYREFGGVTGDTAGYYVTVAEGTAAFMAAAVCVVVKLLT